MIYMYSDKLININILNVGGDSENIRRINMKYNL